MLLEKDADIYKPWLGDQFMGSMRDSSDFQNKSQGCICRLNFYKNGIKGQESSPASAVEMDCPLQEYTYPQKTVCREYI
jgi:hypothetical protein